MARRRQREFDSITQAIARIFRISTSRSGFAAQAAIVDVAISQPSYALLRAVIDDGPSSLGDLAKATHMELAMATRQVAQLVEAGHATKEPDPSDQRRMVVDATEEGRRVAASLQGLRRRHLEVSLKDWSAEDLATFDRLLVRFVDDTTRTSFRDV